LLLSIYPASIYADNIILLQGTYLSTGRISDLITETETVTTSELGFSITNFKGEPFGFYTSAAFLFPIQQTNDTDDTTINLNSYTNRVGFDALLGGGYYTHINTYLSLLLGTGVHFNGLILNDDSAYYSYVLGPGLSANLLVNLSDTVHFNIGFAGAWDFVEFYRKPDLGTGETYEGGFTFSLSTGMAFSY
jgi:hypothetical protein